MQKRLFLLSLSLLLFTFGFSQKQVVNSNMSNITWNTESHVIHCSDFHATKPLIEIAAEHPIIENRETSFTEYPDKDGKTAQTFMFSVEKDGAKYGNDPSIIQTSYGKLSSKAPMQNWAGQAPSVSFRPFDPTGAAGPNHYVQMINSTTYEIWDKEGVSLATGVLGDLWTPTNTENSGDPIILYDKAADRWFLSQFGQSGNKMYIAISQTNDPTGSWYAYTFSSPDFPDYLKFSVWQDGYYMTSNQSSQVIFAFNRNKMLAGDASAEAVYQNFSPPTPGGFFSPLPADAGDGVMPDAGTPCPILSYSDDAWGSGAIDGVNIYNASVDWSGTPVMTVTSAGAIPTSSFDASYDSGWNDIEQPGTSQKLDGIGGALMFRAQWKTWSDHNSLVLSWGVKVSASQRGVFWCELRQDQATGNWTTYQDGIYTPGTGNYWMSSVAMNDAGDIALCYAKTDPTNNIYMSLGYAGRHASDALGTLPIAEVIAMAGEGAQTSGNRNGDYSHTSLDPDGYTFWHTGEYMAAGGTAKTQVYSFRISEPYDPMISATAVSTSQIDIDYTLNDSNEPALIAWSADGTFGTPVDGTTYSNGELIPGGGTVLVYDVADGTYNHTGLAGQTKYYYKAWSYQAGDTYSQGFEASETTLKEAPTNHVTNFATGMPGGTSIPLTWTDAVGSVLPDGYIIKVSNVDFASIIAPVNGTDEADDSDLSDGTASKKVSFGTEAVSFGGLTALTTYYFKIYPYTNSETYILYKTDGTVPEVSETTTIEYCDSEYSNQSDDWITNVTFNTINNNSEQDGAISYGDYTAISTDLVIGNNYDLSVSFSSSSYTEHVTAWIDWNNNGDFTDAGEEYIIGNGASTTLTTTVTVPGTANIGLIRMRVIEQYSSAPTPCGPHSSNYGETEDYSLNILAPAEPIADFSANPLTTTEGMNVNFTDESENYPTTWTWTITPGVEGTDFSYVNSTNSTSQDPVINFLTANTYTVTLDISNSAGSDSKTKTDYITIEAVSTAPVADFVADVTSTVTDVPVSFTDLSTQSPTSWAWEITPGVEGTDFEYVNTTTSSSQNPNVNFLTSGTFSVQLTATNGVGSSTPMLKTDYIDVADVYLMSNNTITTCSGAFYDTGGADGQYSSDENLTMTFMPGEAGKMISFYFNQFDVELGSSGTHFDYLKIYDGVDASSTLIGDFSSDDGAAVPTELQPVVATNPDGAITFVFESDGSLVKDGWAATISCTDPISVNDISNTDINIYPNPSNGIFTLQSGANKINSFEVYDMSGKMILSKNTNSDKTTIDLSNQAHGLYFIKMFAEDNIFNAKLIIK